MGAGSVIVVGPFFLDVAGIAALRPLVVEQVAVGILLHQIFPAGDLVGGLVEEFRSQPGLLAPVIVGQTLVPVAGQGTAHAPAVHGEVRLRAHDHGEHEGLRGSGRRIGLGNGRGEHPGILGIAVVEAVHRIRPLILGQRGAAGSGNGLVGIARGLLPVVGLVLVGRRGLHAGGEVEVSAGVEAVDDTQVGLDLVRPDETVQQALRLAQVGEDELIYVVHLRAGIVGQLFGRGLVRHDRHAQVHEGVRAELGIHPFVAGVGRLLPLHDLDEVQVVEGPVGIALAQDGFLSRIQVFLRSEDADDIVHVLDVRIVQVGRIQAAVGAGRRDVQLRIGAHRIIAVGAGTDHLGGRMLQHHTHAAIGDHLQAAV